MNNSSIEQNEDTKKTLVLALGSNLGNRYYYLYKASRLLAQQFNATLTLSNIYESEPWGNVNQARFLNSVVVLETSDSITNCLLKTQAIEKELRRQKREHWGPRNIDIDILLYGDERLTSENLIVPHAQLANRNFVYVPLLDLNLSLPHDIEQKLEPQKISKKSIEGLSMFASTLNHQITVK